MRFTKFETVEFRDTARKRSAYARKMRLEREALPLFADEIASEQIDADTEMAGRAARWSTRQRLDREHRAAKWREGRRKLRAYAAPVRAQLLAYWQSCRWPADPVYLLSMLHMFKENHLELHTQPQTIDINAPKDAT
jgi:urease accessory protein UreF